MASSVLAQVIFDGLLRCHADQVITRSPAVGDGNGTWESLCFLRGQNRRQKPLAEGLER